ncbi:MAG TPA: hypothetical protein VJ352_14960 [Geodermatophilus sp.]|nr:hypothetical protein [Geodermatophilus sp.]
MTVDEARLDKLLGRFAVDVGAGFQVLAAVIGGRLGLYHALLAVMPAVPADVAREAGVDERYVREWLATQAAGGYVSYDAGTERFFLTEEQTLVLADPEGMQAAAANQPRTAQAELAQTVVPLEEHYGSPPGKRPLQPRIERVELTAPAHDDHRLSSRAARGGRNGPVG